MKILTKEEEQEHYNATLKGGVTAGLAGLGLGVAGVYVASARYPAFRHLTLQFRAFLGASAGTFGAIIGADRASRSYELQRNPQKQYVDKTITAEEQAEAAKPVQTRAKDWLVENRYPLVFGSWVASMGIALGLVGRNPYLSTQQKIVQARVYAQGLTVAVLVASFGLEATDAGRGKGRWETIKVLDPNDPQHKHMIEKKIHHERYAGEDQWRDMVEAEEQRMKEREQSVKQQEDEDKKKGKHVKAKSQEEREKPSGKVLAP